MLEHHIIVKDDPLPNKRAQVRRRISSDWRRVTETLAPDLTRDRHLERPCDLLRDDVSARILRAATAAQIPQGPTGTSYPRWCKNLKLVHHVAERGVRVHGLAEADSFTLTG